MRKLENLLRWVLFVMHLLQNQWSFQATSTEATAKEGVKNLSGSCLDTFHNPEWWVYMWCYKKDIFQYHSKTVTESQVTNPIGVFSPHESSDTHHIYRGSVPDCKGQDGILRKRYAEVSLLCCDDTAFLEHAKHQKETDSKYRSFIQSVNEKETCSYYLAVCSKHVCSGNSYEAQSSDSNSTPNGLHPVWRKADVDYSAAHIDQKEQLAILERIKNMFFHAYDSYIASAYPAGELKPLSCTGGVFEPIKIPLVSLIDTLDTLVIMGEHRRFREGVELVNKQFMDFNIDENVSVFETTIRILGGLLSAHLFAVDKSLGIYDSTSDTYHRLTPDGSTVESECKRSETVSAFEDFGMLFSFSGAAGSLNQCTNDAGGLHEGPPVDVFYNNSLLTLALDLGERLLPAFNTKTGIPFGTVNLRHGVPRGETDIASTAGAGSLMLEFEVLSRLSGDRRFGDAAHKATKGLFERRSSVGLMGKHINTNTGKWFEGTSGIGSNSDSFYEYLLKSYLLFHRLDYFDMFSESFLAIKQHVQDGDWFADVDMNNGKNRRNRVESLHGFWAGMETSIGLSDSSTQLLNSLYGMWSDLGFLPEEIDQAQWLAGKDVVSNAIYPLRPELIESTYHHYRTTGDRSWLNAGLVFLESLESQTRTSCGYAAVSNIQTRKLEDSMPSFFLSETCKYLYLLYDEDNFVHNRGYIFSTEAHPFLPLQLPFMHRRGEEGWMGTPPTGDSSPRSLEGSSGVLGKTIDEGGEIAAEQAPSLIEAAVAAGIPPPVLGNFHDMRCSKRIWWDKNVGFDSEYLAPQMVKKSASLSQSKELLELNAARNIAVSVASVSVNKIATIFRETAKSNGNSPLTSAELYRDELVGLYTAERDKRRSVCLPNEEENPKQDKGDGVLQVVEFNIDGLGEFITRVFLNGFGITSKQFGDTLEISNVGQELVHGTYGHRLSPQSPVFHRGVTGFVDGSTSSCYVSLVDSRGVLFNRTVPALPLSKAGPWEGPWEKPCSTAMFGQQGAFEVTASVVSAPADDPELCKSKYRKKSFKSATSGLFGGSRTASRESNEQRLVVVDRGSCMFEDKAVAVQAGGAVALIVANNEENVFIMSGKKAKDVVGLVPLNSWQQLTQSLSESLLGRAVKGTPEGSLPLHALPLSEQESSESASQSTNTEAGPVDTQPNSDDASVAPVTVDNSKDIEGKANKNPVKEAFEAMQRLLKGSLLQAIAPGANLKLVATEPASASPDSSEPVTIPTVMLSKSDAAELRSLTVAGQGRDEEAAAAPQVRIERQAVPMALDTPLLGYDSYPKIRTSKDRAVFILSGKWSALVSTATGVEWQLYIVKTSEILHPSVLPFGLVTPAQQILVAQPPFVEHNDVEKYTQFLSQKCPSFLTFDGKRLHLTESPRWAPLMS